MGGAYEDAIAVSISIKYSVSLNTQVIIYLCVCVGVWIHWGPECDHPSTTTYSLTEMSLTKWNCCWIVSCNCLNSVSTSCEHTCQSTVPTDNFLTVVSVSFTVVMKLLNVSLAIRPVCRPLGLGWCVITTRSLHYISRLYVIKCWNVKYTTRHQ